MGLTRIAPFRPGNGSANQHDGNDHIIRIGASGNSYVRRTLSDDVLDLSMDRGRHQGTFYEDEDGHLYLHISDEGDVQFTPHSEVGWRCSLRGIVCALVSLGLNPRINALRIHPSAVQKDGMEVFPVEVLGGS